MADTYSTSETVKIIGIHPNTVRPYETLELIPKPERKQNGYRVFTDFHIAQFKLARTALKVEVLQNGLRKKAMEIIKTSATGNIKKAETLVKEYLQQIIQERLHADEAIAIAGNLLSGEIETATEFALTRKKAAAYDKLLTSLRHAEENAKSLLSQLAEMKNRRATNEPGNPSGTH
jgi:DNA-binding transcriptional MerR regulator